MNKSSREEFRRGLDLSLSNDLTHILLFEIAYQLSELRKKVDVIV